MNMINSSVFLTKFEEVRIYNELGWRGKMHYQVYLDSFFMQEFVINFYVLLLCKVCFISTTKYRNIIWASLFLASYQTATLLMDFPKQIIPFYGFLWFWNVLGAYVGVRICFGKNKTMVYIKQIAVYMMFLFVVGGVMLGLLPRFDIFKKSSVKVIFFLASGALIYTGLKWLFKEKRKGTYYGKLKIQHEGCVLEGQYFMDSGNSLVESISKKPVLLADEKWMFQKLEKEQLFCRPIIYKSVGKKKGVLYAYCMDELIIYGGKETYTYEKVWIGICTEDLFLGRDYQIIIPPFYGGVDK